MDAAALSQLVDRISTDRFSRYLDASGGDRTFAFDLYVWNIAVSSAFYGPLQVLEVTLRNALHDAMTVHAGSDSWWDVRGVALADNHVQMITEAKMKVERSGRPRTAGRVVAELPFGFWVGLLGRGRNYEMALWRPVLRHALPGFVGLRHTIHSGLDRIRTLRNRIAHHEPIFHRHLVGDFAHTVRLSGSSVR